jgi:hypothetical protein
MSKLKHTPGPWEIDKGYHSAINKGKKHIAMINFFNCREKDRRIDETEHQANARLIAETPNMLDVLIEDVKKHCRFFDGESFSIIREAVGNIWHKKILAIESATGQPIEELIK